MSWLHMMLKVSLFDSITVSVNAQCLHPQLPHQHGLLVQLSKHLMVLSMRSVIFCTTLRPLFSQWREWMSRWILLVSHAMFANSLTWRCGIYKAILVTNNLIMLCHSWMVTSQHSHLWASFLFFPLSNTNYFAAQFTRATEHWCDTRSDWTTSNKLFTWIWQQCPYHCWAETTDWIGGGVPCWGQCQCLVCIVCGMEWNVLQSMHHQVLDYIVGHWPLGTVPKNVIILSRYWRLRHSHVPHHGFGLGTDTNTTYVASCITRSSVCVA